MPQCLAKFCTVVRGNGISTFSIPDPKKNYELCAKWIQNLGNAKLNPKTFVFSKDKIVCERHFKEDCIKEDIRAKIMGYTPHRKQLKEDAVPTIFDDSKPKKRRQISLKRSEKKKKQEIIRSVMKTWSKATKTEPDDQPCPSTMNKSDVPINHRKRKSAGKVKSSKKIKLNEEMKNQETLKIPIQSEDKSTSCNIQIEIPNHGPACILRINPLISISDHNYCKVPSEADPPIVLHPLPPKKPASDSFHDSLENLSQVCEKDDLFQFSENTCESPVSSPSASSSVPTAAGNNLSKDTVNESKFVVFSSCLDVLFKMIVCQICHSPFDFEDVRKTIEGSALKVNFSCLNHHSYSWKYQPYI
ncbi:uncharacterized protein LOC134236860 [Saccostrea cucullata]|uniref:uncharacterized protein LOC134236860 n=1 Tax=Saccostrea cuccullata TaxID=36930 RepID=UPI002ED0F20E